MISYYRRLVAEQSRMEAFQQGIEAAIHTGDMVCEIGTGLGTYAFMASRAGAGRVYAIEEGRVIELARKLYAANQDQLGEIEFIEGHSTSISLPVKVNTVIYENYDCQGLSSLQEAVLKDACRRFLKPGGTFIPEGLKLYWAALQAEDIWRKDVGCLEKTGEKVQGLDFSLTRQLATNERIVTSLEADVMLSSPHLLESINFHQKQKMAFCREFTMDIVKSGTLHGFGSWADFIFPGGHVFSLSYAKPVTSYCRAFFPISDPISVESGDTIQMKVAVAKRHPHPQMWSWWGKILDRSENIKAEWQSSSFHLFPFQGQDYSLKQILNTSFRPSLNGEGLINRFVLGEMTGERAIREIAMDLMDRFPNDIPNVEDATAKVIRIVKKYSNR